MENTQFILQHTGTITINHEYTVTIAPGQALLINWFPNNDIIVNTANQQYTFNTSNTTRLPDGRYLIQIITTQDLLDVPVQFERGDYIVANNIVINQKTRQYFTASALDIFPDELVAAHGNHVTRVLFNGDKSATEHYVKRED